MNTPTDYEIITNPQSYHHAPAVLQSSWASLKAQRGQPITPDRMDRLHPAYGIIHARPMLHLPAYAPQEAAYSPARMARISAATRRIAQESGYPIAACGLPSGGNVA